MIRALVVLPLVVALLVPEASVATTSNGGVAAPTVVAAPQPPKKRKRRKRSTTHRLPVAGAFTWPGPGALFGAGRPGHVHQGVDLMAAEGTPVVAPYTGTVTFVDYQPKGAGYYVVLRSSDYDYVFMHLAAGSTRVREGQNLAAGARIGDAGATGAAEGSHLHFEAWKGPWQQGGAPVDPLPLLKAWR